jgi:hypothetical protein
MGMGFLLEKHGRPITPNCIFFYVHQHSDDNRAIACSLAMKCWDVTIKNQNSVWHDSTPDSALYHFVNEFSETTLLCSGIIVVKIL